MKCLSLIVVATSLLLSQAENIAVASEPVTVKLADPLKPDKALLAVVDRIRQIAAAPRPDGYSELEGMFAPKVATFQRSLDPLQPWRASQPITENPLAGAIDMLVEQGAPPDNAAPVDFRPDLLRQLGQILAPGIRFGQLAEVPKAICAPAAFRVDRRAALRFAAENETEPGGLKFYARDVVLRDMPDTNSPAAGVVPAYQMISFIFDRNAPNGWSLNKASNGVMGYLQDSDQTLYLSQQHVCFRKIDGQYRIVALFGYGL